MKYKKGQSGNPKGRPKGIVCKASMKVEEVLLKYNYSPQEQMIKKAQYAEELAKKYTDPVDKARFLEIAAKNDRELMKYIAPQRKAVDHTGFVEQGAQTVHHSFGNLPREMRQALRESLTVSDPPPDTDTESTSKKK